MNKINVEPIYIQVYTIVRTFIVNDIAIVEVVGLRDFVIMI